MHANYRPGMYLALVHSGEQNIYDSHPSEFMSGDRHKYKGKFEKRKKETTKHMIRIYSINIY